MRDAVIAVASDPNAPPDLVVKDFAQFLGMLAEDGAIEEAERVAEQLLGFVEQVGEPEHVDIYWAIARLRSAEGRFAEADRNYRLAYAALTKAFPDDLTRRAILIANMASVLRQQYRQRDAEQLFRRAAEDSKSSIRGHPAAPLDGPRSIAEQNRPAGPVRSAGRPRYADRLPGSPLIATSLVISGCALATVGPNPPATLPAPSAGAKAGDGVGAARRRSIAVAPRPRRCGGGRFARNARSPLPSTPPPSGRYHCGTTGVASSPREKEGACRRARNARR
jgi:tetratricopeptide (TPR) repeat protein